MDSPQGDVCCMLPLMTVLYVDLLIGNVANIYSVQVKSDAGFSLFLTISVVSIAGQFYFLGIVMKKMNEPGNEPYPLKESCLHNTTSLDLHHHFNHFPDYLWFFLLYKSFEYYNSL
jgi:hypothetical protein